MQRVGRFAQQALKWVTARTGDRDVTLLTTGLTHSTLLCTWVSGRKAGSCDSMGHLRGQYNMLLIKMQNLVLSWYLMITVILMLAWERRVWGSVPLVDSDLSQLELVLLFSKGSLLRACQMRAVIFDSIMQLCIVGCGWFPTHLGQNLWVWPILVTYHFQ